MMLIFSIIILSKAIFPPLMHTQLINLTKNKNIRLYLLRIINLCSIYVNIYFDYYSYFEEFMPTEVGFFLEIKKAPAERGVMI